jgi:hypothetical protein
MKIKFIILSLFLTAAASKMSAQIKFDFQEDEHDFGVLEEGGFQYFTFEFQNSGVDTIHLKEETRDVRPGCGCTTGEYTKDAIPPGGKGYIKAGYNTQGRIGGFIKNITVSQKGSVYKILTIKGVVLKKSDKMLESNSTSKKVPALVLEPKSHFFGRIEKGKPVGYRFTLKNIGKDTLKIIHDYSACQCFSYKLLNPKDLSITNYVLPGKSVLLEVNYNPAVFVDYTDSKTSDILTFFTNDPKNSKIELNLSAEVY